ncbi:GIY-YIG nuclease family protein [Luteimonas aquatica]|uniref:GIY-YIG nuclease family protein n=1 Tax=Luteimonas aquatica TaxID=450364 RepID=UPI001F59996B|nr:GIY-YIG nuclease family protein [Luteimonas aquatica]
MRERLPAVYLLASKPRGTLYVGVTSDLARRVTAHKACPSDAFTRKYSVHTLVWYETHDDMRSAIIREKRIKAWKRLWKIALIENANPDWRDLSMEIL